MESAMGRHRNKRTPQEWSEERKIVNRNRELARTERLILTFLVFANLENDRGYVAADISEAIKHQAGFGYIWPALMNLEREGLAFRAFDYEDWRTLHVWKITGCGLLATASRLP
jgi:hypothetical protein